MEGNEETQSATQVDEKMEQPNPEDAAEVAAFERTEEPRGIESSAEDREAVTEAPEETAVVENQTPEAPAESEVEENASVGHQAERLETKEELAVEDVISTAHREAAADQEADVLQVVDFVWISFSCVVTPQSIDLCAPVS